MVVLNQLHEVNILKGRSDLLWRLWYPILTRLTRYSSVTFLNYGYAESTVGPALSAQDEPNRPCIQLYHHVVSAIDMHGLDVLEVSCGHLMDRARC